jgi:uncharacterized protein DUF4424
MRRDRYPILLALTLLACIFLSAPIFANDSAASTAAGGIQLTREARISMQKERLFISIEKVRVEYEFLNETDGDIQTDIAFPIPEFDFEFDDPGGPRSVDDFKVWVEGKEIKYKTDIKAHVRNGDVTKLLNRYEIDLNSFGHFDWDKDQSSDFAKLSQEARTELLNAGAFNADEGDFPNWTVSKTYYWTQVFPARGIVHIAHEYKPIIGFRGIETPQLDPDYRKQEIARFRQKLANSKDERDQWSIDDSINVDRWITDACVDASTRSGILSAVKVRNAIPLGKNDTDYVDYVSFQWVDYILTTANSWKTPIGDFQIVIEKSGPGFLRGKSFVSFCWDGPVEKLDDLHFIARAKNFVPKRELHIAFFD